MRPSFFKGAFFGLALSVALWIGIIYGINIVSDISQVAAENMVSLN